MMRNSGRQARWVVLVAVCLAIGGSGPPACGRELVDDGELIPDIQPPGVPFLLKDTDARVVLTGPVAHVVVTQTWKNPNRTPVDGLYIFPLPANAAVNDMQLVIGRRTVQAEMHRREEARKIYEQARREGKVAGLLDQERPNIFAQRVANIMPGVTIQVVLAFDQEILCDAGDCEYSYPTVVGPRFIPEHQENPGEISPPVVEEGSDTGQVLFVEVRLDTGVPVQDLRSPSHRIQIDRTDDARARVALAEGPGARLNRDFRLRWSVGGEVPEIGLMAWRDPERLDVPGAFTLILQPPAAPAAADAVPRELVFVLDCSGSMRGIPIEAAKNVVRNALRAARSGDTFQIIRFSVNASGLGPEPLPATEENIEKGLAYLETLQGQGGTHMMAGVRVALDRPTDPDRLRIVAFLTDGYIGNETEVFATVRHHIGDARLFSFGIGSSVNRYLLEGLAAEGRGVAAFLGPRETPDEMVDRFIRRIDTPVLTDIRITWEDVEVGDLEPARIPDLFAGQALLLHGRYTEPGTGVVIIEGRRRGRFETFRKVVVLTDDEKDHEALARLWARARIHRLSRELHEGPRADIQEQITALGLTHRLMTQFTSLVAVDSETSNRTGGAPEVRVPVEMPEDVSYEGVFGKTTRGRMAQVANQSAMRTSFNGAVGLGALAAPPPVARAIGSPKESDKDEAEVLVDSEKPVAQRPFTTITLQLPDGARLVVEEDGEVWKIDANRRTLVHALNATEADHIRDLLGTAQWASETDRGALVVVGPWGRATYAVPTSDPAIRRLAELLTGWAS